MNKFIWTAVVVVAALCSAPAAQAHWGHWHGGHWHGGWHGGWGGGWRSVGWGGGWRGGVVTVGGWNGGWGWGGGWGVWNGGWGPTVWTRRTVMFAPQPFIRPVPVFYSSPVIVGGGCGWLSDASVIDGGLVSLPAPGVYAPAGIAYGPDSVKEFMGVDRDFAKGPLVAPPVNALQLTPEETLIIQRALPEGARIVAAPRVTAPRETVRVAATPRSVETRVVSHPEAKLRAQRYISSGDTQFGEQQYHSAVQRYREAAVAAPDVADAHFRQGFAYIASNRLDLATKSFRRGLELDPLWVNSSFRVDSLYGRNQLAKDSHLEGLARAALEDRTNPDHLFLIGLVLHFDGQTERAKKFFTQAEKRAAGDDVHINAFLAPAAPAAADAI